MSWRCAALVGCASRRSAPSLIAGGESISGVVVGRTRTRCVARAFPHFVIGGHLSGNADPDTRMLSGVLARCIVSMDYRVSPVVTKKASNLARRKVARAAQAAKGDKGIGAKSRHSSRRPSGDSPWQNPGANASREQRRPARPLLQCSCEQRSRIRPSNKCPASGICMTWGRRQTQNVHRPCLRVYTRTAISRMRRSPRVQRGRAIFCSIAAGANCRSVACARSAH